MNEQFNLVAAIRILLKWKRKIFIIVVASAVIAAFVSFFILDEYFLSSSVFYPSNPILGERSALFNSDNMSSPLYYYGDKTDVNRLLTIANSSVVSDYVINKYHLADHYKIAKDASYRKTKVEKEFEKNFSAIKTEHEAIEISLYDTDAKLASTIVNDIVNKVDSLNKIHSMEVKLKLKSILDTEVVVRQKIVDSLVDSLGSLATRYHIKSAIANGKNIIEGDNPRAVQLYKALIEKEDNAMWQLNKNSTIHEQNDAAINSSASSLVVIEKAEPAERRAKPIRSLVILSVVLITMIVSILGVFLIEQIVDIKKQLSLDPVV